MSAHNAAPNPGAICATLCHDCGAEMDKPSDVMRHKCPIALARAVRLGNQQSVGPSYLYSLCRGDGALYNHALREAGYIVLKATGEPEDPCAICGWSPTNAPRCESCGGKGFIVGTANGGGATDGVFSYERPCESCDGTGLRRNEASP